MGIAQEALRRKPTYQDLRQELPPKFPNIPRLPNVPRSRKALAIIMAAALSVLPIAEGRPQENTKADWNPEARPLSAEEIQNTWWRQPLRLSKNSMGKISIDYTTAPHILRREMSIDPDTGNPVFGHMIPILGAPYGVNDPEKNPYGHIKVVTVGEIVNGGLWFEKTDAEGKPIDENGNLIDSSDKNPIYFHPDANELFIINLPIQERFTA